MLAIDTNVVVRFLARDDPEQSLRAKALIAENKVFVSLTVMLEAEWVLRSAYGFDPAQLMRAFRAFAGLPNVVICDAPAFARAVHWAEVGMDFADALHLARSGACAGFASFDRRLAKAAGALDTPQVVPL